MSRRKILILVHDFPPHAGGTVMRILKFVKYLPNLGWNPIVVTVRPEYYRNIDESLLSEIPGEALVLRTRSLQAKAKSQRRILKAYHQSPTVARRPLKRIREWMYSTFFVIQDEDYLWLPHAWVASRRLLREHDVKAVLTTSPPHAVHWLGLALKQEFKLPWIVDFRDAWVDNPLFKAGFPVRRWVERRVERATVTTAEHVITATPPIADHFRSQYPITEQNISVILNGYDPEDFAFTEPPLPPSGKLTMVHAGSVGGERRSVRPLLDALARLKREVPKLENRLRLLFVGSFGPKEQQLVVDYHLSSIVESTGWLEHRDAIKHMFRANVLLVISSEREGGKDVLTGKVFEYIAAERFVLVLAPQESAVAKLVTEAAIGLAVPPNDVDAICAALKELYRRSLTGTLKPSVDPNFKLRFNRFEQTRDLVDILDTVT